MAKLSKQSDGKTEVRVRQIVRDGEPFGLIGAKVGRDG
jgi:hypothetical protein